MKLKIDDKGNVAVADGKPVYVYDDGKELPFDAQATVATITRLNGEAMNHREAKETLLAKLKTFEGIDDPASALQALETLKNIDAKRLVDAGEVEKVKTEAVRTMEDRIKGVEAKIEPLRKERDDFRMALHSEKIGHAFAGSKFLSEKMAENIKPDMAGAMFASRFKVDGNDIVGYDGSGNKIFSREKPGESALFDEALEIMVDQHPNRDFLLRGSGARGGGAQGGGAGVGRTVTRAAFDKMDPATRADIARAAGKGEVALVD